MDAIALLSAILVAIVAGALEVTHVFELLTGRLSGDEARAAPQD